MSLPIDYKIDKIVKQIQAEIKTEHGIDISFDTVVRILESQIIATAKGMSEGQTIVWKYFGTFVATKKRVDNLNKRYTKVGKPIGLKDTGFMRMSFKKNGEVGETKAEFNHKNDYYVKPKT